MSELLLDVVSDRNIVY